MPVIVETDSLMVFNCLSGIREVPWSISGMVKKINTLRGHREVKIQYIRREGNKVVIFFSNHVSLFARTSQIKFLDIHRVSKQGQTLLTLDAQQVPNIRLTKVQNISYSRQQRE